MEKTLGSGGGCTCHCSSAFSRSGCKCRADHRCFSESPFWGLKYCPQSPEPFGSFTDGDEICRSFFSRYNHGHPHNGIDLITPVAFRNANVDSVRPARSHRRKHSRCARSACSGEFVAAAGSCLDEHTEDELVRIKKTVLSGKLTDWGDTEIQASGISSILGHPGCRFPWPFSTKADKLQQTRPRGSEDH